ncbi:Repetin [Streptomyces sp. NPDC087850]|uniref:Repetin n=1 Tax=Streptomyces sp. NPDC087850 TaxID=3365809 RepID=UPI0038309951
MPGPSRPRTAALVAALLLAPGAAPATAAPLPGPVAREAAALTGSAKLYRSAGDDITFAFDARLAAEDRADPTRATGTFAFSHEAPRVHGSAEGRVDCLLTGGKVAVVSGVITRADRDLAGAVGTRVGMTVHDRAGGDRLGYSWALAGTPTARAGNLPRCVSSAPFERVAEGTGDFVVVPWRPTA